jgi:hypothetical protein
MSKAVFRALVEDGDGGDRQMQQCRQKYPLPGQVLVRTIRAEWLVGVFGAA